MIGRSKLFLGDALDEARALQKDLEGKDLRDFKRSRLLQRVTERSLEIIGEAIRRALFEDSNLEFHYPELPDWVWLRNVISHQYDNLILEVIWQAATVELLDLITTLESLPD